MACNRNRNRTLISVLFLLALSSCKGLIFKFEPYEYKIVPKEDVAIVDNGVYFKPIHLPSLMKMCFAHTHLKLEGELI